MTDRWSAHNSLMDTPLCDVWSPRRLGDQGRAPGAPEADHMWADRKPPLHPLPHAGHAGLHPDGEGQELLLLAHLPLCHRGRGLQVRTGLCYGEHLPLCLTVCLSVSLSICLAPCLPPVRQPVRLSTHLSDYLPDKSDYLSPRPSVPSLSLYVPDDPSV